MEENLTENNTSLETGENEPHDGDERGFVLAD